MAITINVNGVPAGGGGQTPQSPTPPQSQQQPTPPTPQPPYQPPTPPTPSSGGGGQPPQGGGYTRPDFSKYGAGGGQYTPGSGLNMNPWSSMPSSDALVADMRREIASRGVFMVPGTQNFSTMMSTLQQQQRSNVMGGLESELEMRQQDIQNRSDALTAEVDARIEAARNRELAGVTKQDKIDSINERYKKLRAREYDKIDDYFGREFGALDTEYEEKRVAAEEQLTDAMKRLTEELTRGNKDSYINRLREKYRTATWRRDNADTEEEAREASEEARKIQERIGRAMGSPNMAAMRMAGGAVAAAGILGNAWFQSSQINDRMQWGLGLDQSSAILNGNAYQAIRQRNEYESQKASTWWQAGAGATGALAGAAIGSMFGGVGAIPGYIIGGLIGMLGGSLGGQAGAYYFGGNRERAQENYAVQAADLWRQEESRIASLNDLAMLMRGGESDVSYVRDKIIFPAKNFDIETDEYGNRIPVTNKVLQEDEAVDAVNSLRWTKDVQYEREIEELRRQRDLRSSGDVSQWRLASEADLENIQESNGYGNRTTVTNEFGVPMLSTMHDSYTQDFVSPGGTYHWKYNPQGGMITNQPLYESPETEQPVTREPEQQSSADRALQDFFDQNFRIVENEPIQVEVTQDENRQPAVVENQNVSVTREPETARSTSSITRLDRLTLFDKDYTGLDIYDLGYDKPGFAQQAAGRIKQRGFVGEDALENALYSDALERVFSMNRGALSNLSRYDRFGNNANQDFSNLALALANQGTIGMQQGHWARSDEYAGYMAQLEGAQKSTFLTVDAGRAGRQIATVNKIFGEGTQFGEEAMRGIQAINQQVQNPGEGFQKTLLYDVIQELYSDTRGDIMKIREAQFDQSKQNEIQIEMAKRIESIYGSVDTTQGFLAFQQFYGITNPNVLKPLVRQMTQGGGLEAEQLPTANQADLVKPITQGGYTPQATQDLKAMADNQMAILNGHAEQMLSISQQLLDFIKQDIKTTLDQSLIAIREG